MHATCSRAPAEIISPLNIGWVGLQEQQFLALFCSGMDRDSRRETERRTEERSGERASERAREEPLLAFVLPFSQIQ